MILYLDTSALIKFYISEEGSQEVAAAVREADALASSTLAYPEALATLARVLREKRLTEDEHARARDAFNSDWQSYTRLSLSDDAALLAGTLAERYPLKGADAVHLASAYLLNELYGEVRFMAFDKQLVRAAEAVLSN